MGPALGVREGRDELGVLEGDFEGTFEGREVDGVRDGFFDGVLEGDPEGLDVVGDLVG